MLIKLTFDIRILLSSSFISYSWNMHILSVQFCGKGVDFYLRQPPLSSVLGVSPPPEIHVHNVPPDTFSTIKVFDGDGRLHIRSGDFSDSSAAFLSCARGTILHKGEELTASTAFTSPAPHFFTSSSSSAR